MAVGNNREIELADKAVTLIKEIVEEVKFFGEDLLKEVRIDGSPKDILIEDVSGCRLEYNLSEVSYILTDSIDGLWRLGESLEECISTIEKRMHSNFEKLDKTEFIEYAGKAEYIKFRFYEILNILRKIEREL